MNGYAYINNQGYILEVSQEKLDLPVIQGIKTSEEKIVAGNKDAKLIVKKLRNKLNEKSKCEDVMNGIIKEISNEGYLKKNKKDAVGYIGKFAGTYCVSSSPESYTNTIMNMINYIKNRGVWR